MSDKNNRPPDAVEHAGVVCGCDSLIVRTIPRLDAGVLCVLNKGDCVTITEDYDNWLAIRTKEGKDGYCMKKFIQVC